MSSITISSLPRITSTALYSRLTPSSTNTSASSTTKSSSTSSIPSPVPSDLAIIDVRDGDHEGGHIRGSTHVPSRVFDESLPGLLQRLGEKKTVVFHCALSQQRGPKAAVVYARAREEKGLGGGQEVCILEEGFVGWQDKYGLDEKVTEDYNKDLWEFGGP